MTRAEDRTHTGTLARAARPKRLRPNGRLIAVYPPELEAVVALDAEVTLGRDLVAHPTLSRRHLAFRWDAIAWALTVADLGSKNGSAVDGVALGSTPRIVRSGSTIRAGDVLFVLDEADSDADSPLFSRAVPGRGATTCALRAALARAAADTAPVLLLGETGTGKEQIARALHEASGRHGPFVAVSCAELTSELAASQLFGHARGAFTGAAEARPGLFRAADGGTLFLDEIGELPAPLQPKLLRALQEGEVLPVGETRPQAVDVRILAATHAPLDADVERGTFRRDLYARLAFWVVTVPPLRERRADLLAFIPRLLDRRAPGRPLPGFTPDAAEALLLEAWPANLRGLEHLVHRAGSLVTREDLDRLGILSAPAAQSAGRPPTPSADELARLMADLGSVRAVAKHMGRDRRQIYRWLRSYGLRDDE